MANTATLIPQGMPGLQRRDGGGILRVQKKLPPIISGAGGKKRIHALTDKNKTKYHFKNVVIVQLFGLRKNGMEKRLCKLNKL